MIRWLWAVAASVPLPALALSCMPWDVDSALRETRAGDAAYRVVSGDLDFDPALLPVTDWANQMAVPPRTEIPARLTGFSVSKEGFTVPFDAEITLVIGCAGPWCASAEPGPSLAFVQHTETGWVLEQGPCGGFHFARPDADMLAHVAGFFASAP